MVGRTAHARHGDRIGPAVRSQSHANATSIQGVLLKIWRTTAKFAGRKASVLTRTMTIARRRAIDRVRQEDAAATRVDRWCRLARCRSFDAAVEGTMARMVRYRVLVAAVDHRGHAPRGALS